MSVVLQTGLLVARFLGGEPAFVHFSVSLPQIPQYFSAMQHVSSWASRRLDGTQFPG
ncbi:hypothetical protein [Bradyrhizobium sp. STM 3557]|uniref:hypothetical protein n=1 Tax=Bradyrhizobium sp. STM 3557 TaxID=578920 RepID=UPI00388FFC45